MCRVPGQDFSRDFTMDESQLPPTRLRVWLISRPKTFPHNFWLPVLPCPSIVHRFHRLKVWLPWSPRLSSSTSWVECHSSRKIYFVVISTLKLLVTTALFIVSNLRSEQTVKKQIKNAFLQTAPCYFWLLKSWFYYSSFAITLFFCSELLLLWFGTKEFFEVFLQYNFSTVKIRSLSWIFPRENYKFILCTTSTWYKERNPSTRWHCLPEPTTSRSQLRKKILYKLLWRRIFTCARLLSTNDNSFGLDTLSTASLPSF